MKTSYFSLVAAAMATTLGLGSPALAQQAGNWSASIGVTHLAPQVTSGNLSAPSLPNTQASVNSNTQLTGAVNYMLTDNIALSVPLGFGFKHQVTGAGSIAGAGKLADTKALPITLLAQYRFMAPDAAWRPYVGAGLTYANFYDTKGTAVLTAITNPGGAATTISFKSKLVPTVQLGMILKLSSAWYLDAHYTKTYLKTVGTLSTGQTLDMRLNPDSYSLGIGYRF